VIFCPDEEWLVIAMTTELSKNDVMYQNFEILNVILKVVARGFGKLKENNEKFSLVLSRCLKVNTKRNF
jgi:hypothetical protein